MSFKLNIEIHNKVQLQGWQKIDAGYYRSSGESKSYNEDFDVYKRVTPIWDFLKKSQKMKNETPHGDYVCESGSNAKINRCFCDLTPGGSNTPSLGNFDLYQSLQGLRSDRQSLLIGFDSEWYDVPREMLSWQFAVVHKGYLYEIIFFRKGKKNLWMEYALGRILDLLGVRCYPHTKEYEICTGWSGKKPVLETVSSQADAVKKAEYIFKNGKFHQKRIALMPDKAKISKNRDWDYFNIVRDAGVDKISLTLVCHAGKVDISSFDQSGKYKKDILHYCSEVQGGLITLKPMIVKPSSTKHSQSNNVYYYPVTLSIADTMCHAPADKKSLKVLGEAVGIKKVELQDNVIQHMDKLLFDNPALYFTYASNDAVVTLMYASALYGFNRRMPVTLTSATARSMRNMMMNYLHCHDIHEFNSVYRGLRREVHGLVPEKAGFVESSSLEPLSHAANMVQKIFGYAYHGGYNACFTVGYYPFKTYDYDLRNAYPTALCLVPDVDWQNPIKREIRNRDFTVDDFRDDDGRINPILLIAGYVTFEFPSDVRFPTIPTLVDGVPAYVLSSEGLNGVYACGPEIFLALKLGARVFCEHGLILNPLKINNKTLSHSVRTSVYNMVKDRKEAKQAHGKGSLEELTLKTMVNSGYGKIAQNVIDKHSWSAYTREMEELGCSGITNPVSACMATSIVRAVLLATLNQIAAKGYDTYSVTTDGFISNIPENDLKRLDLYGLRSIMEESRLFLTDNNDSEIWEKKHEQEDLVNFTTRGNVSLSPNGVCAHNSCKSPYPSDSYEDRLWLMTHVLSRVGPVTYEDEEWTGFRELVEGKPFSVKTVPRNIRMDFDLKRKPMKKSMSTVYPAVNNIEYEIVNFSTEPYKNVSEFRIWRYKATLVRVLRTEEDWNQLFLKVSCKDCKAKVRDLEWSRLTSVIAGYRAGLWSVPYLDRDLCLEEKLEWINAFNTSTRTFKESDWKNCRRPERVASILPIDIIGDLIASMSEYKESENETSLSNDKYNYISVDIKEEITYSSSLQI